MTFRSIFYEPTCQGRKSCKHCKKKNMAYYSYCNDQTGTSTLAPPLPPASLLLNHNQLPLLASLEVPQKHKSLIREAA